MKNLDFKLTKLLVLSHIEGTTNLQTLNEKLKFCQECTSSILIEIEQTKEGDRQAEKDFGSK